jgi:hypothetical protein
MLGLYTTPPIVTLILPQAGRHVKKISVLGAAIQPEIEQDRAHKCR